MPDPLRLLTGLPRRALHEAQNALIVTRSGMVSPMRPSRAARLAAMAARWGASPATALRAGAIRHPDRTLLVDEQGSLTYAEADRRTNAVAHGLRQSGLHSGQRVGVMCRDGRGFLDAAMGAAKVGAHVLLLNTSFAAPQLAEVCEREDVAVLIHDAEFAGLLAQADRDRPHFVAHTDGEAEAQADSPSLEQLIAENSATAPPPPSDTSHVTILTSGT